jgi:hypothetical protein
MGRKVESDVIATDLAAVRKMLTRRSAATDPLGYAQFQARAERLERQLNELGQEQRNKASLSIFFSGEPVVGSRGIRADFAGKAVNVFQELIAKQFANMEVGAMAGTGPVPFRTASDMLLTDIARGSVGLVLEEADLNDSLTDSELKVAVHRVAEDIKQTALPDATAFEQMLGEVDNRYFTALGALFKLMDDSHATVRLVENEEEFELDAPAIHRARERTDAAITNDDDNVRLQGRLFLLPVARRFELALSGEGVTIQGSVSREFAHQHLEELSRASDVNNHDWIVRVKQRTILRPNKAPQTRYTLLRLVEPVGN